MLQGGFHLCGLQARLPAGVDLLALLLLRR